MPRTSAATASPSGSAYRIKLFTGERSANLNASLLTGIVLVLVGFGLIMVLSSSAVEEFAAGNVISSKFLKQFIFAAIGVPLMLVAARIPLQFWTGPFAWLALGVSVVLQALVFTPLGLEINGNRSWLDFGVTTVQPAEFAKVALVIWLGLMVARKGDKLRELKHLLVPVGLPVAVVIGLALLGKDLGTVMVIGALVLGALWFGGIRMRYLVGLTAFAVAGAVLMAIISPNRVARITSFFDGSCDYEGLCWQTSHGFFALARGGLFGVGLGNSTAKWSWLPEADNDFIFAIIGEEFGLVGALAVILLFGALALVLLRIWRETRNPAGRVVIGGVLVWFIFQAFVNIAVVLGLLPVLGVPLPLLSSGGSALITSLFAIGLALSVARDNLKHDLDAAASPRRKVSAK
ncbi:putative lipid II flippase FtsW [Gulosibacter faecalis]|jgi:cell division protein FtsW|uniref:Probable peptidoglycan glycosyltransferase FtsW n=1 Tax=Gulosibacter faecalis TaxID=272240 RepID=A0ABW5V326_9MICO|nr:putative lipid II flippase FtsW [Gulosibacter faecalis]